MTSTPQHPGDSPGSDGPEGENRDQMVARDDAAELAELRMRLTTAHQRIEQLEDTLRRMTDASSSNTSSSNSENRDPDAVQGIDRDPREPHGAASDSTEGSPLLDPESKLFSEAYFKVALEARLAAAKRHLRPVSVALIQIDEGTGTTRVQAPALRGAEAIRNTLRDADTACRLPGDTYALILEDTPENGAVWTVERVRRNLISRFGAHTMWAGVACYPAHAFSSVELLAQAQTALTAARDWNQDRIEVAIAE